MWRISLLLESPCVDASVPRQSAPFTKTLTPTPPQALQHPGDAQWLVHLWSYLERDAPRVPRSRGLHWVLRASRVKSYKKSVSQTFHALSTPIPSNFPRTFPAHTQAPTIKLPIPILSSAYSITYSLGYSMPMHDDSCHHSCHHSWSLHGVFVDPLPSPLPPNFLIAPPPDTPKLA